MEIAIIEQCSSDRGGAERSSLNKILFSSENVDSSIKSDLQKYQSKLPWDDMGKQEPSKISFREVPENNFLALEIFKQEAVPGSIIFFPKSFYSANKSEFYEGEDFQIFGAWEPTRHDKLNKSEQGKQLPPTQRKGENVFNKELQLFLKLDKIDSNSKLKDWLKRLLLKNIYLSYFVDGSHLTVFYDDKKKKPSGAGFDENRLVDIEEKVFKKIPPPPPPKPKAVKPKAAKPKAAKPKKPAAAKAPAKSPAKTTPKAPVKKN